MNFNPNQNNQSNPSMSNSSIFYTNSTIFPSSNNSNIIGSNTSINQYNQELQYPSQVFFEQRNCTNTQLPFNQDNLKSSQCSETGTYRSSFSNNSSISQVSSESGRNVEMVGQYGNAKHNSMDIESEQSSAIEERKVCQMNSYTQYTSSSHLIQGDFLIDLTQLESIILSSQFQNANEVDFSNSILNSWKKCAQIEKDSSNNGCFYLHLEQKQESTMTSIEEIGEMLQSLKERKLAAQNQMSASESEKFDNRFRMIESLLENIETQRSEMEESSSQLKSNEFQMRLYEKHQQYIKKAKSIMKNIVSTNGSTNSFVFAKLKAFNPSQQAHELTHLIYSPKLIQTLYGNQSTDEVFYNQVLRKGIIEMFDSLGHLTLSTLESSDQDNQKRLSDTEKKGKISMVLYTSDNFQVPITVTLKKFNLSDESENSQISTTHELLVFDMKIKIKYQRQLKKLRRNSEESMIKKRISKNTSSNGKKHMKRKSFNQKENDLNQIPTNNDQTENQQEFFGYYLESLGFLNKFYPEKLSDSDKFDNDVLQKK